MTRKDILRYILWEWIEPIGSALGIALIVMHFIVALYVIPTGSMQPTLRGAGDYGVGDKVIVNKFIYRFQPPQRWDVFVFLYPYKYINCGHCELELERNFPSDAPEVAPAELRCPNPACRDKSRSFDFEEKEFIKRCVALPGDEIGVRDGNIVLWDGQAFRPSLKTQDAQESVWIKAFDSRDHSSMEIPSLFWKGAGSSIAKWQAGSVPVLSAGGETLLFHNTKVLEGRGDKSKPAPESAPLTGDVAIDLEISQWPSSGELELEISRNLRAHQLTLNLAKKTWAVSYQAGEIAKGNWGDDLKHLRFARVDGQIQVLFNDQMQQWPIPAFDVEETCLTVFPKIRYEGSMPLALQRLKILRDIYYTDLGENYFAGSRRSYKLRSDEYFAIGDNPYWSADSRVWGPVPQEKLIGKALVVLLPLGRTKFIH